MRSTLFNSIGNNFFVAVASKQLDARAKKTAIIFAIVVLALALFIAAIYQHNKSQKIIASPLPHKPRLPDQATSSIENNESSVSAQIVQTSEPKPLEISGMAPTVVKEPQTVDVDKQELPKEVPSISALEETSEKVQTAAQVVEIPKVVKEPQTADVDKQELPKEAPSTPALEETSEKVQAAAEVVKMPESDLPSVPVAIQVKEPAKEGFDWERKKPFANKQELLDNACSCKEFKALYDQDQTIGQPRWRVEQFNSLMERYRFSPPRETIDAFTSALVDRKSSAIIEKDAKKGKLTCDEYVEAKGKMHFDSKKRYHTTMHALASTHEWKTPWKPLGEEDLANVSFEEYWDKQKTGSRAKSDKESFALYCAPFSLGEELLSRALSLPIIKEQWDKLQEKAREDGKGEWKVTMRSVPLIRQQLTVDLYMHEIGVSQAVTDQTKAINLFFAGILQALGEADATKCEALAIKKLKEAGG